MLYLILALNLFISWFNCRSVGRIWNESRALGGMVRVLAWCGAVQAAVGFSSVIGFILGAIAFQLGYLPASVAKQAVSLWYVLIIVPALGTGLIITIESWIIAWRERSLLNMGTAAYNSLAMAHNIYGAVTSLGDAFKDVGELVGDLMEGDDKRAGLAVLAFMLAIGAILGGCILTAMLIKRYAGTVPLPRSEFSTARA